MADLQRVSSSFMCLAYDVRSLPALRCKCLPIRRTLICSFVPSVVGNLTDFRLCLHFAQPLVKQLTHFYPSSSASSNPWQPSLLSLGVSKPSEYAAKASYGNTRFIISCWNKVSSVLCLRIRLALSVNNHTRVGVLYFW